MRAFIVCPFGQRDGIDFDAVVDRLISPALAEFEISGRTTRETLESGSIHADMFQALLLADIVIADISLDNPNVFYELGIRHAFRERITILIRTERPGNPGRAPFDIATFRYLSYNHADPAAALPTLRDAIVQSRAVNRQDSPVFLSLPSLDEHPRSRFFAVPLGFREEVEHASATRDLASLVLLGMEARGFPWESEGLRQVGRAQLSARMYHVARNTWERIRSLDAEDVEANNALANVLQRLGDRAASSQALQRVLSMPGVSPAQTAEAHAQIARNKKDEWREATGGNPEAALRSNLLEEARAEYCEAYEQDLNSYYAGLNALATTAIVCELAASHPEVWAERFETDEDAEPALRRLRQSRDRLAASVRICIDAHRKRQQTAGPGAGADVWLRISDAEHLLLTSTRTAQVEAAYKAAVPPGTRDFVADSARRQIEIYRDLGLFKDNVEAALRGIPTITATSRRIERVLLFAGHRIDSPSRQKPRFPAGKESVARDEIRRRVVAEKEATQGPLLGIAGAADGGDILFLETCLDLGIPIRVALALPPDAFINESVQPAWVSRFWKVAGNQPDILSQTKDLPLWLAPKAQYNFWERNNHWLIGHALAAATAVTLIALWDGDKGDGAGGTQHMAQVASSYGARFVHIDTRELFQLG